MSATNPSDEGLAPGTAFGPYRIERSIGAGGMGHVYAATHLQSGEHVALKIVHSAHQSAAEQQARFVREAETLARLQHPNIVRILDAGVSDGTPYFAMQWLKGGSVARKLKREGRLDITAAVDIAMGALLGLQAIHDLGLVHRDIKPANVVIAQTEHGERPTLVDFGLVKDLDHSVTRITRTSFSVGTPAYMSPEQLRDSSMVDARTDIYAVGVLLYECICGGHAFSDERIDLLIQKIIRGDIALLHTQRSDVPRALSDVVHKAMSLRRSARYQSAREFAVALMPFASERVRNASAAQLAPRTEVVAKTPSFFWSAVIGLALFGVAIVAIAGGAALIRFAFGRTRTQLAHPAARSASAPPSKPSDEPTQTASPTSKPEAAPETPASVSPTTTDTKKVPATTSVAAHAATCAFDANYVSQVEFSNVGFQVVDAIGHGRLLVRSNDSGSPLANPVAMLVLDAADGVWVGETHLPEGSIDLQQRRVVLSLNGIRLSRRNGEGRCTLRGRLSINNTKDER